VAEALNFGAYFGRKSPLQVELHRPHEADEFQEVFVIRQLSNRLSRADDIRCLKLPKNLWQNRCNLFG